MCKTQSLSNEDSYDATMKFASGLLVLLTCIPYLVWADDSPDSGAVAATATSTDGNVAADAPMADSNGGNSTALAAVNITANNETMPVATATAVSLSEDHTAVLAASSTIDNVTLEAVSTYNIETTSASAATTASSACDTVTAASAIDTATSDNITTVHTFPDFPSGDATATASTAVTSISSDNDTTTAVATTSATSSFDKPIEDLVPQAICICQLNYDPVCGSDGVTYSNKCILLCISNDRLLRNQPPILMVYRGECQPLSCNCPQLLKPICGTNNLTYTNDCYRICDNRRRTQLKTPLIGFAYNGVCRQVSCVCPDAIIPVCGTDGKTYRNICILQYNSRQNQVQGLPEIYVKYANACQNEKCICPLKRNQICGSDDTTYHNPCALNCQNRRRNQLGQDPIRILYRGECDKCICPLNIDPVCGSDGITYNNYCIFMCKNQKRKRGCLPELFVRWRGSCNCGCTENWKPICANDRKTWPNRCLLGCENRKRLLNHLPPLTELYDGECNECNCCHCSNAYKPVCASDRQTYWNACFLNCNSNCRVASGRPPIWKICDKECNWL